MTRPFSTDVLVRSGGEESDATLMERVLQGQTEAFAGLVSRYQGPLFRHAVTMVLDREIAADLVQDAFVRAYVNLRQCRDAEKFRSWIFQTLRNRCLDHLKEARRRDVRLDDVGRLVDGAEGPDSRVERGRLRTEIRNALAQVPDAQREAFLMRHVEGLSYEEMAELLDVSVSALKMRVLRARESLATLLARGEVTAPALARLYIRSG